MLLVVIFVSANFFILWTMLKCAAIADEEIEKINCKFDIN